MAFKVSFQIGFDGSVTGGDGMPLQDDHGLARKVNVAPEFFCFHKRKSNRSRFGLHAMDQMVVIVHEFFSLVFIVD